MLLANSVDLDQMPLDVASDLGLHCLTKAFYGFPGKNWVTGKKNAPSAAILFIRS